MNFAFPTRSRALLAAVWGVASFAALAIGTLLAASVGGGLRLLVGLAAFGAYAFLFGKAVGVFQLDELVLDRPDSTLLRSGTTQTRRHESSEI